MTIVGGSGAFRPVTNWLGQSLGYQAGPGVWFGDTQTQTALTPISAPVITIAPVTPTFDPKFDANALYGKPKLLFAGGLARIGAAPAPLLMPWIRNGLVNFVVWICYPVPIDGTRVLFDIAFDNEIAWTCPAGGTLPAHGTFMAEAFDFTFTQGRMDQSYVPEENRLFPGDENAYRPACLLEIRNLPYQRYMDLSGRPVPYVAPLIGDTTGGADPYDGINLGEAMERIAYSPWCRRTSANYEAVGITDVVGAILIKENFNIVQIGQAITQAYPNIDQLTSDKIRLKDRGSIISPDIVLNGDSIIASSSIFISRSAPSEQPRQEELLTIEAEADYTIGSSLSQRPRDPFPVSASVGKNTTTLPVVMDAQTRQALVTFKQHAAEVARKRMRLVATGAAYRAMPGDLVGITGMMSGIDNEVMKLIETTHGANYRVEMTLEAILRCRLFAGEGSDSYFPYVILLLGGEGADGSTTFTDESPSLRGAGTVSGDTQVDTAQFKFGSASIFFDGTGDALDWPDLGDAIDFQFGTQLFTVEMFIRPGSVTGTRFLMGQWQASGDLGWVLYQNGATLTWSMTPDGLVGSQINIAGGTVVINVWQHVAFDFDGTTYRLYLDGAVVASSASPISIHPSTQDVAIGSNSGQTSFFYSGHMDEIRVTKGVARYAGAFTPATAAFPRF